MMDDAAAASTADSGGREQKVAHKFNAEREEEGEVQKASGPEKYAWKFSSRVMSHSIRREGCKSDAVSLLISFVKTISECLHYRHPI